MIGEAIRKINESLTPRCWVGVAVVALAPGLVGQLHGAAPRAADFSEVGDAYGPIRRFVAGSTIAWGSDTAAGRDEADRWCNPFPAQARMLAYEENRDFLYAVADASPALLGAQQGASGRATFIRRLLFLKPSVLVVDDVVRGVASRDSLRWLLRGVSAPLAEGRQLRFEQHEEELVCQVLWPTATAFRKAAAAPKAGGCDFQLDAQPMAGTDQVRWIHVFHWRRTDDGGGAARSILERAESRFELAITTGNRRFRIGWPAASTEAGDIAIDVGGKPHLARRPLPSGILPHGPEGVRLIERWDSRYRDGRRPPWDTGVAAQDLKRAVEDGVVRPCRTAVLGCGSGTNAIYLAQKGFDVTAIDIAPTALSIARAKADQAGVRAHWMLADVLALPDLKPFDFIFDRGCYHNVRYVDASAFIESVRRLSHPGTRFLVLSLNRDGPPGVREHHMRDDFSDLFEFQWLRDSGIRTGSGGQTRRASWSAMLRRKDR